MAKAFISQSNVSAKFIFEQAHIMLLISLDFKERFDSVDVFDKSPFILCFQPDTMNLEDLDKLLIEKMKTGDSKDYLRSIAHWLKKIKQEGGEYSTDNEKEVLTLKNIESLGLLETTKIRNMTLAFLTPTAEELMKDFFRKGYYMQDPGFNALLQK